MLHRHMHKLFSFYYHPIRQDEENWLIKVFHTNFGIPVEVSELILMFVSSGIRKDITDFYNADMAKRKLLKQFNQVHDWFCGDVIYSGGAYDYLFDAPVWKAVDLYDWLSATAYKDLPYNFKIPSHVASVLIERPELRAACCAYGLRVLAKEMKTVNESGAHARRFLREIFAEAVCYYANSIRCYLYNLYLDRALEDAIIF